MSAVMDRAVAQAVASLHAGLAGYTQSDRLLRLHTALGPDVLIAERLDGCECLTGLWAEAGDATPPAGFRHAITAFSADAGLDPDALLGQAIVLELLCADSRLDLRPFHGHVTSVEQLGSNGGLARYRLTVEPWLAFLDERRDSYVFQDQSVIEIIDEIFGDYAGAGALVPAWRWQLADERAYPKRSLTIQYRESDLAFVLRLLAEEGLFGWFEHAADIAAAALGSHCLVIADANTGFAPDIGAVRFHRASSTEADDSLQRLDLCAAIGTQAVALTSWDYVSLDTRALEYASTEPAADGELPLLTDHDTPGLYAYADRTQGARLARVQARARALARHRVDAAGTQRRLAAGCRFRVDGHPRFDTRLPAADGDAAAFLALRVSHRARNNLPADFSKGLDRLLGPSSFDDAKADHDAAPLYRNEAVLLPAAVAYAPQSGSRRKPIAPGVQTATVVGAAGIPITTDRDHRIKVQFHWQRGARAQSRRDHPAGADNAPGNEASGTWVRVAAPVAGSNWGGVFLPRIGQEVVIEFIEGDIDRPVVIGSLYNGRGQNDAAGNQAGQTAPANTANAPAWFSGNGHPGALSGLKTQALASSQSGQGGFNQLLFDATPGQARFELATTQYNTQLRLGHQRAQNDNARAAPLGHGISLASDAYGAFRAGQGMLVSADARYGGTHAGAQALDAAEAIQQLGAAEHLAQALADTAKAQTAVIAAQSGAATPAIATLQRSQSLLQGDDTKTNTGLAWTEPMIVTSAPDGIVMLTPDASITAVGSHLTMTAGHAMETLAQGDQRTAAKDGIVLFTHGGDAPAGAPETLSGIQLHAAQGPVSLQAQSDSASLAARKDLRIASTTGSVTLQAREQLLLTAQGAYIRLHGGNIEVHAPGRVEFRGASKCLVGPKATQAETPSLPKANELKVCEMKAVSADAAHGALVPLDG